MLRLLSLIVFYIPTVLATTSSGNIQAGFISGNDLQNWQDKGTGIHRYHGNEITFQQAHFSVSGDVTANLNYQIDANLYPDGDQHAGFSQLQLQYKPLLNSAIKWRSRVGFFYPAMSLENVDNGWLSPYTYSQSAINSWLGEELRILGAEFTLFRSGRAARSQFSWEINTAVYKGNDPLGSLIVWRGFALHDRQSLHHERVQFADYPSVVSPDLINHPSWIEPFTEIDGKWGVYVGFHLDYLRKSRLRYYYYDNLADPNKVNQQRLYAWRTKFHSLALQHTFDSGLRIIIQALAGSTLMGENFVQADYAAFYTLLSKRLNKHRLSMRADVFNVSEDDIFIQDQNNSHGISITANWQYTLTDQWSLGLEHQFSRSSNQNRRQFAVPERQSQQLLRAILAFRW